MLRSRPLLRCAFLLTVAFLFAGPVHGNTQDTLGLRAAAARFLHFLDSVSYLPQTTVLKSRIKTVCDSTASAYGGTYLSAIAKAFFIPSLPDSLQNATQAIKTHWLCQHYTDNLELGNPAIVQLQVFQKQLDSYFSTIVPQQPDSLAKYAIGLLEQCSDTTVYHKLSTFVLARFLGDERMEMDTAAWTLAHAFTSGRLPWYGSEEDLSALKIFVDFNSQCLLGDYARPIMLQDARGRKLTIPIAFRDTASLSLLYFYEDGCPVCAEETEQLLQYYAGCHKKRLHVYTIYTQGDKKAWAKAMEKFPKTWTNLWDPNFSSGFQKAYNVRSTPKIFLLDHRGIIVGKNIRVKHLQTLIKLRCDSFISY